MGNINFLQLFSEYQPPEPLAHALSQAVVADAEIDAQTRRAHVLLRAPHYIPLRLLRQVEQETAGLYELSALSLRAEHPASELQNIEPEELRELFVAENAMNRGALAGAEWTFSDGNSLTIRLRGNGKQGLMEAVPAVCRSLRERFGTDVTITVESAHDLSGSELFAETERLRDLSFESLPPETRHAAAKPARVQEEKPESFYGKPFRGEPIAMKDMKLDMGTVIVQGRVFHVDHRELKKRNAWIINFDMTDNTGSVRVNTFMENKDAQSVLQNVAENAVLRVQGRPEQNRYDGETILKPYAMGFGTMPKRQDLAEGEKRVELHLHTKMSNMDALTDTAAAVKQAAAWGHRAIAITDHGCAQSFPDAMKAAANAKVAGTDENIKILYGCEGYYVNDVVERTVVLGKKDAAFTDEFVAFDLETTGLSPVNDTIIEIGAVILKEGKELDRFQTFVNPERALERKIVGLTGITDAMLADAPKIEEVLPKFLEFVGDRVLVAHNADFDTGFIRMACKRLGLEYTWTSADTLVLAQNLMPQLNKHKLDMVSSTLGLPDFNHHRAGDDALTCGLIFMKFLEQLAERGLKTVQQINAAMPEQCVKSRITDRHPQHIILLAKNQVGLRNLYHLISDSNLEYFKRVPRIPRSELTELREGLIIGSACEAGELFQAIVEHKSEDKLRKIAEFYDYLEIQPIANNRFMLFPKKPGESPIAKDEEELREFNRTVVRLGEELGKPVVATGDVHFLNPEDEIFRHILLSVKKLDDGDRETPLYFRTTDEMLEEFSYLGAEKAYEIVVTNPNRIADMCETLRPVPHNLFAPSIENSVEDLKSLVYGKLHRLYGENPPERITQRVETELHDIINCHYDVIYMSAQKLVQNSLEHGYLVGSRGSVGSSIVAYMAGITEVNAFPPHYRCPNPDCKFTTFDVPEGYGCGADLPDAVCPKCGTPFQKDGFNIPFETFLGFGGGKVPDIDLNFSGEYQARAHAYCVEMFGKSHVFRAGTVGAVAEKTAFGYVKKYMSERGMTVSRAEETRLATGCVGVRRTTGQHPGGLVVIPQENEIWDFCPVQHPADDPNSNQITTHFEYHSMEENLLKLDMLGHDDPTMIRMMEDLTGVNAQEIPLDDKKTMSIFTSSKVLGYEDDPILGQTGAVAIPEFNTRFTRGMLKETMPTRFETLLRLSGFSHGTDVWLGNARDLVLSGTATVDQAIGCRDDIMLYLISCGMPEKRSFKIMESVRKGRGLPEGAEAEMVAAGVPDWYIESCKKIKYLFPRAHAVAYVMMAFRIAWFKVYHPLAFYSAYFYRRSQKGGFDALLMTHGMDTVRQNIEAISGNEDATDKDADLLTTLEVAYEYYLRGFEFLPIDLFKSHATKFLVEDGKLRPPFVSISGLGETAAWDLMEGRKGKQFISIEEIALACPKVSKTHIQMLKEAGAFGSLPDTSQVSLF